ncbi:hypothetical protein SprV_0100020800 [Sparganum proliferum]
MQMGTDLFAAAGDKFGLVTNTEKTAAMYQSPHDAAYVALQINMDGAELQFVDNFTCLNNALSCDTKIDDEVARQIYRGSQGFAVCRTPSGTVTVSVSTTTCRCTRKSPCRHCCME